MQKLNYNSDFTYLGYHPTEGRHREACMSEGKGSSRNRASRRRRHHHENRLPTSSSSKRVKATSDIFCLVYVFGFWSCRSSALRISSRYVEEQHPTTLEWMLRYLLLVETESMRTIGSQEWEIVCPHRGVDLYFFRWKNCNEDMYVLQLISIMGDWMFSEHFKCLRIWCIVRFWLVNGHLTRAGLTS